MEKNEATNGEGPIKVSRLTDELGVEQAVEIAFKGVTDDGVPEVHSHIIANDPVAGQVLFDAATASHGDKIRVDELGFVWRPLQEVRSKASTSMTGAYESNDPNAATWRPTGPKEPGKPRLN